MSHNISRNMSQNMPKSKNLTASIKPIFFVLLAFTVLLLWGGCEDEVPKKAKKTAMIITSKETDEGLFEFRIDSLIKEDSIILERATVPEKA
ncbi:MAG: hypothetical protein AAF975_09340, partial [Spirochaetota bacterium]